MNSPTLTSPAMTQAGMILGTAAYMAPEQARGKAVDKRADIWAFGAVLFEMLTGTRAFPGDDVTDTLAAVVRGRAGLDAAACRACRRRSSSVLRRCLQKDPKQRIPDMAAMRLALEGAFETAAPPATTCRRRVTSTALVGVGIGCDCRRVARGRRVRALEPARGRSADRRRA